MKIFGYSDKELYEYMCEQGKKRFGLECKHNNVKQGRCIDCFRKVYAKKVKK